MSEELKCTRMVKVSDGKDNEGRELWYTRKCDKSASEVEIGGMLTKAKAILCARHAALAHRQSFTSVNGYPLGKIERRAKENGYHQDRLPGTGKL